MGISIESNLLRHVLKDAYFINGTAYAGKSTMVRMLAEKHDGICCKENYHEVLMNAIDPENQPNLSYFSTMKDWQEFISRTPQEYAKWIEGCSEEAAQLELICLIQLAQRGKKIFVDTNLSCEKLKELSNYGHVAILLTPREVSVERFFDRADPEKQFILQQIQKAPDPEKAMENYRACLERINSEENYRRFENSGFFVLLRDDRRAPEETLEILEKHFKLSESLQ